MVSEVFFFDSTQRNMPPKLRGQQHADMDADEVPSATSETTERDTSPATSTTLSSGDTALNALGGMFQEFMQFQKSEIKDRSEKCLEENNYLKSSLIK